MAGQAAQRLQDLKDAADDYFSKEKKRLNAQFDFLDAISKKRGGSVGLQDANAQGASKILANSISDYLGSPLQPSDDK
jgi:hypothetical protein